MQEKHRVELYSKAIDAGVTVIQSTLFAAVLFVFAYFGEKVLIAFAGKSTNANVSFSILAKLQADRWFAYMFGAIGMGYGYAERKLRQRGIRRMAATNSELEKRLDPARTSSGLTVIGTTPRAES